MASKRLYIKIRIRLLRPMTKQEALSKLKRAIGARRVPEGIELAAIDWQKGEGLHARSGSYLGPKAHDALVDMARVIESAQHRRIAIELMDGTTVEGEL